MSRAEWAIYVFWILALMLWLVSAGHAQDATDTATAGDSASAVATPPPPPPPAPAARGDHNLYRDFLDAIDAIFERVRVELVGNAAADERTSPDCGAH